MAGYEILFKESVFKDLQVIPKTDLRKILSRIERLADDPRPAGSQKLTGADLYRVRQGVYRIVYSIHDRTMVIHVVKVGHRKEVYRYIVPTGQEARAHQGTPPTGRTIGAKNFRLDRERCASLQKGRDLRGHRPGCRASP